MDSKIEILLNKTNIDKEHYQYFSDAKITRIVVNKQGTIWNIFIDKKDPTKIIVEMVMAIVKEEIKYDANKSEIGTAIVELAVLNELATILTKKSCYISGQPSLSNIKRSLYPYWLMYLSVPKDEFPTYMSRDKIAFDANKMAYEKELKKMNIEEFIDFCYRNKRYIVKPEKIEII